MRKEKVILFIILISIFVRIALISLPGFKYDVDTWFAWAQMLNSFKFSEFYSDKIWTNYTPGFLYILALLGFLKSIFLINDSFFYIILKVPAIIADILLGIFVFNILKKRSFNWAITTSSVVFLNPVFIFNSTIWGQIDSILALFMFLTIYFLNQKKLLQSSIFFGISILIKPQAIMIIPVIFLFLLRHNSIKKITTFSIGVVLTILIYSLPFFISKPIEGFINLFSKMISDYPYTSLFAYNFWGAFGFWINDKLIYFNISLELWGKMLLVLYLAVLSLLYFKKNLNIFALSVLVTLGFYFLPTRIHERYLYPGLFLLIFYSGWIKSKLLMTLSVILSLIHFLNLYYVYIYYNEIYLKLPLFLYNSYLYNFLSTNGRFLSILSTSLFLIINLVIIRIPYVFRKAKP